MDPSGLVLINIFVSITLSNDADHHHYFLSGWLGEQRSKLDKAIRGESKKSGKALS